MKPIKGFLSVTGSLFALCCVVSGATLLDQVTSLTLVDPTQTGRLSRNDIPQDWTGTELFPGVINTGTTYHFHTFSFSSGTLAPGRFVQIELDHVGPNQGTLFVSAYSNAYLPDSAGSPNFGFDTNWLGDAALSPNLFGTDPVFLQVLVPAGAALVVVVNNTDANDLGVGESFRLIVESYSSVRFSAPAGSPTPTPHPYGVITSPPPGSTLPSSSVTFSWTPGTAATAYWLTIGDETVNEPGGSNILSSGQTGGHSWTATNLPTDGRTLFVRLWSNFSGTWFTPPQDYTYTAQAVAVLRPIIAPNAGTFRGGVLVNIATATPRATIFYTRDGSDPTTSSNVFTGPFRLTGNGTVTLKAIATKTNVPDSEIAAATYALRQTRHHHRHRRR